MPTERKSLPAEPTRAMLDAWSDVMRGVAWHRPSIQWSGLHYSDHESLMVDAYQAMLNAAPPELPAVNSASRQALASDRSSAEAPSETTPLGAHHVSPDPVRDSAKQPAVAALNELELTVAAIDAAWLDAYGDDFKSATPTAARNRVTMLAKGLKCAEENFRVTNAAYSKIESETREIRAAARSTTANRQKCPTDGKPCQHPIACEIAGKCPEKRPSRDMRSTAPWISEVLREIQEMPDRTSPADFPTAMLVTARELRGILERHAPSASRAIHIAVLRQNEKRRVVLAVYSKDATEAERVARGKYTGWSLESLKLKDDPTVFRLHDDAWLEADSVQPEEEQPGGLKAVK